MKLIKGRVFSATVMPDGRIVLPRQIIDHLKLQSGDMLTFQVLKTGKVVVRKGA